MTGRIVTGASDNYQQKPPEPFRARRLLL